MRHLDLFSGIAGFALACSWVWGKEYENVGHSEVEPYACKVYHRHFPRSQCLGDITKIKWQEGQADLITGGFPCQPHSVAGKRKASADERDLWGECVRAIRGVRPHYFLGENVPGLFISERGRFFNRVIADLSSCGYDVEWRVLSAQSVGAPHKRERVWIVAHTSRILEGRKIERSERKRTREGGESIDASGRRSTLDDPKRNRRKGLGDTENERATERDVNASDNSGEVLAHAKKTNGRRAGETEHGRRGHTQIGGCGFGRLGAEYWQSEPNVGRVAHGVPFRVDRLKGLGNSIVPQVAQVILEQIKAHDLRSADFEVKR